MKNMLQIVWDIDPIVFTLGPLQVAYYGLLFAGGLAISYYIMKWIFKKEKENPEKLDRFAMYTILGAVIGARFGHILFYAPEFYWENPGEILKIWHGGLASHGGALGILIAIAIYQRTSERSYLWLLDKIAIPTALTGSMIRLGNLMNSEIYGHATDLPWGFVFQRMGETQAMHPTQTYESLAYLLIFVFLISYYKRNYKTVQEGRILGFFFVFVFGFRFFIEFLKYQQSDLIMGHEIPLNMGQFLSIPVVLFGFYLIFRKKR